MAEMARGNQIGETRIIERHLETMTPRERVNKALNHEETDRVPIDLGGFQTGFHWKAYESLLRHPGMDEAVSILDPVQQIVVPSEAILRRFHADVRCVTARGKRPH